MSHWHTAAVIADTTAVTCGVMVFDGGHHFSHAATPHTIGPLVLRLMLCEMAVRRTNPLGFFVSLVLPASTDDESSAWVSAFQSSIESSSDSLNCPCLGLTVTKSGAAVTVIMTAVGDVFASDASKGQTLNSGHRLYVAGYLGDRYIGRQIEEGHHGDMDQEDRDYFRHAYENPPALFPLTAALKTVPHTHHLIRTGLGPCLLDMCAPFSLRAYIKNKSIPRSPAFQRLPLSHKMDDILMTGQDYTLLLTVPPGESSDVHYISCRFQIPLTLVGHLYQDCVDD